MLKRMEDLDRRSSERWERLDKRFEDVSASLQEHEEAVDSRITSLESFAFAQYTAAIVADNWGAHFDSCVTDLEQRMADLEMIRVVEYRDERDDRVSTLEEAVGDLQAWRSEVDDNLDDVRYDLRRFSKSMGTQPQQPPRVRSRPPPCSTLADSRSTGLAGTASP
ncbi:uncharacterized protein [Miscanthus floridulus]|uniref:uncharacterized protein n=1 Tax=Miscanthus floridulus TaxID=154761 RepID=UPI00345A2CC1